MRILTNAITAAGVFMVLSTAPYLSFNWSETAFIAGLVMMVAGATSYGRGKCRDCEEL